MIDIWTDVLRSRSYSYNLLTSPLLNDCLYVYEDARSITMIVYYNSVSGSWSCDPEGGHAIHLPDGDAAGSSKCIPIFIAEKSKVYP